MSAEAVAKVIRDIKTGRAINAAAYAKDATPEAVEIMTSVHQQLVALSTEFPAAVIDATPMYKQIVDGPAVDLYADFRAMPVWQNALVGYENEWGNVWVIQSYSIDRESPDWDEHYRSEGTDIIAPYPWETENEVDWENVRYRFIGSLWGGGRTKGKHVETVGPIYRWDIAAYADGEIADIRWVALYTLGAQAEATHQNAMMVWLQTYTLAGCTNVELVTPQRSKPERKRLERLNVVPQTIIIKKTSKSYRHSKDDTADVVDGVPQRFVRGHYARYGAEYGRGLLFGKYSGKFWIPARAVGESGREIDYIPESA